MDENAKRLIDEIRAAHVRQGYNLKLSDATTLQLAKVYLKNNAGQTVPLRVNYNKHLTKEDKYRFTSIVAESESSSYVFWAKDLGNNAFAIELKRHIEAKTKLQFLLIS